MAYEITFAASVYPDWYERWVDPNGNDSNDGLSRLTPMATIQVAYNDLKTAAEANESVSLSSDILPVGTINLAPGLHDVGTGVVFAHRRPAKIRGALAGALPGRYLSTTASTIYSSGTPTQLVTVGGQSAGAQTFGGEFEDVAFRLTSSQSCGIKLVAANHVRVERCSGFAATDANLDAHLILVDNDIADGGDGSWGQVLNCSAQHIGLVKCDTDGQINYWRILNNHITQGSAATSAILLDSDTGVVSCEISQNHIEGPDDSAGPAISLTRAYGCICVNNFGECRDLDFPFYTLFGTQNLILGGRCTAESAGTTGVFINLVDGADFNTVIVPMLRDTTDTTSTSLKDRYTDNTANSDNVINGNGFINLNEAYLNIQARSAPANPAASNRRLFFDDTALSVRTSAGVTTGLES